MTDLASIRTLKQAEIEIKHPIEGVGIGVWFVLAGPEHPSRKRARMEIGRRIRDSLASGVGLDDDGQDAVETDALVSATLGWHGPVVDGVTTPVTFGGKELPFSEDAARSLYTNEDLHWLRLQVRSAVDRTALFIGGSPSA